MAEDQDEREHDLDARTKRQLHRWMAGGRLSRAERDVIRQSVLDEIERKEGRPRGRSGESGQRPERSNVIRFAGWAGAAPVGPAGERLFYFSKEDGTAELRPAAQAASGTQRAVRLSDEHRAGRYRVHAFVADRMLSREEAQRGGQGARVLATLQTELVIVE